jgi:hypothetical protein
VAAASPGVMSPRECATRCQNTPTDALPCCQGTSSPLANCSVEEAHSTAIVPQPRSSGSREPAVANCPADTATAPDPGLTSSPPLSLAEAVRPPLLVQHHCRNSLTPEDASLS